MNQPHWSKSELNAATLKCSRSGNRFYTIAFFAFVGTMASLAALATRNFTTFFAGILIAAPVAGFRPIRAFLSDEQFPILKGKIEGDKITIEADHEGHTIKLMLVLAEDHIKGDASMATDERTMTAKLDVTRVK